MFTSRGRIPQSPIKNRWCTSSVRSSAMVSNCQRRLAGGSNGFSTSAPKPATSATLRVANVIRCILAVAARSASTVGSGRMALMLPHSSATIWSMGRIRSPYDCLSVDSHFSSAGLEQDRSAAPVRCLYGFRLPPTRLEKCPHHRSRQTRRRHGHRTAHPLRTSEMMLVSIR